MAGVMKHATRIVFFTKSIVCLYLDSSWHLLQVCWRRKAFLARFGKEGSLAGKCICRNVHNMEFNYKQFGDVISSLTFTHIQQCNTKVSICLVPRPHYSARPMRFGSCGPREFLTSRIRHRYALTQKAWEDAVQGLGKVSFRSYPPA